MSSRSASPPKLPHTTPHKYLLHTQKKERKRFLSLKKHTNKKLTGNKSRPNAKGIDQYHCCEFHIFALNII
jgi:hypothetical protein